MEHDNNIENSYTIGEISAICNVSKKALRYYDKIGVLTPDYVSEVNGYRYYSYKKMLQVPILKYYKQMGFKLEEMKGLIDGESRNYLETNFKTKIEELQEQEVKIKNSCSAIVDWKELLDEARMVRQMGTQEVSVKFNRGGVYCWLDQDFNYDYMESIINIDWVNYLESNNIEITDAVILGFSSYKDKMNGECNKARVMQKPLEKCSDNINTVEFEKKLVLSVYHIGSHETIADSYRKMEQWAEENGYICAERSYERYVVDYWTTRNADEFVTELIIPIESRVNGSTESVN